MIQNNLYLCIPYSMVYLLKVLTMKRLNYFKLGAIAYMVLGVMHIISQFSKDRLSENVLQTLIIMKRTSFEFMGQHNLMQFYTGFSTTMGFMLFAFGLQALMIKQPNKSVVIVNILLSLIASVLAIIYFHPLAYSFLLFSTLCFTISLIKSSNRDEKSR